MKKLIALLLIGASLFSLLVVPVGAASSNDFDFEAITSSKTISFYANEKILTYTTKALSKRSGSIYVGDLVKIIRHDYDEGVARVQYPTSNGSKRAYVDLDAIGFGNIEDWVCITATQKVKVYRSDDLRKSFGTIYEDDICYIINDLNGFVLYPIGKGFKAGYVNDIDDLVESNSTKSSSTKSNSSSKSNSSKSNSSKSNSSTGILYNVPHFQQRDPDWKNVILTTKTLGDIGCTTTAASMLCSWALNSEITPKDIAKQATYTNNLLEWDSLPVDVSIVTLNTPMSTSVRKQILNLLQTKGPVVIGAESATGDKQHWAIIIGFDGECDPDNPKNAAFVVLDPSTSKQTTLNDFLQGRTTVKRLVYVS